MAEIMSWDVSDEFWARVEPLVPKGVRDAKRLYRRKPMDFRRVFEGIVFVLRTGRGKNHKGRRRPCADIVCGRKDRPVVKSSAFPVSSSTVADFFKMNI